MLCQLSYAPNSIVRWLRGRDLNPRPLGYEPNELPDCSTPRQIKTHPDDFTLKFQIRSEITKLVGLGRVELPTSRLSGVRSNQLSYRPLLVFLAPCSTNFRLSQLPDDKLKLAEQRRHFNAKKSHTSLLRSVLPVDAREGRVASVAK